MEKIINIAIIAHVDHGKTTLVDSLLRQYGNFRDNQQFTERVMDSNDLERERGITILAKCTSVKYQSYKINIVDTPGHADFGGEVERILGMVDGVVLLVDSSEGPMPQTRFVTEKALSLGLKPIVIVNKMDKQDRRPDAVCNEVFDLFATLGANEEQLDFPILYAAARDGWVSDEEDKVTNNVALFFDAVIQNVPVYKPANDDGFRMSITMIDYDDYVGRLVTGRIVTGGVKIGDTCKVLNLDNQKLETCKVTKIIIFEGLKKVPVEQAFAGEIVSIAGFELATVSHTVASLQIEKNIDSKPIDPPLLSMTFSVNTSPLAGKDGKKVTSRLIKERLLKEQDVNVSIKIQDLPDSDSLEVYGRGELQLAILIETMRREGFELSIGRPKVLIHEENGVKQEPIETVQIDVDEQFSGGIIDVMQQRKARIIDMQTSHDNKQRIVFLAPTRGMIGYYSKFLTDTKGTGTMSRTFYAYEEWKGPIDIRHKGVLISMINGEAVAYALANLEERGVLFVSPSDVVYAGMIVGENSKDNDLEVNPVKGKQLSNVRASGKDDAITLTPPRKISLEDALCYIADDELIEVTPNNLRLRKKYLDPNERKRHSRLNNN